MLKVILTVGIPASGKSTWSKEQIKSDPANWIRINNDDIIKMMNLTHRSEDSEVLVRKTRFFLLKEALLKNKNVILDNINLNKQNFDNVCKIAKDLNKDIEVSEKSFYITLEEALIRNSKRTGAANVPEDILTSFWVRFGKESHKNYVPVTETFYATERKTNHIWDPALPISVVCDLDGTLQKNHGRSFYEADTCDQDHSNLPVIETIKMCFKNNYKIIFMSGREEKYKEPTERFFKMHLPEVEYELFMRKTDDQRKDSLVKLELYEEHIKNKYNVLFWLDDRNQVVDMVREQGIVCYQVDYGNF